MSNAHLRSDPRDTAAYAEFEAAVEAGQEVYRAAMRAVLPAAVALAALPGSTLDDREAFAIFAEIAAEAVTAEADYVAGDYDEHLSPQEAEDEVWAEHQRAQFAQYVRRIRVPEAV